MADTGGKQTVFARRRARLLTALGDGILIMAGASEQVRSADVHYRYRQDSDFLYLTGFIEPGATLVLDGGNRDKPFTLYVQPKDPDMERWTGKRVGQRAARSRYGADGAYDAARLSDDLPNLLNGHKAVYLKLGATPALDAQVIDHIRQMRGKSRGGVSAPTQIIDPSPLLGEARLCKDKDEIALLEQAAAVTAAGHRASLAVARPGRYEYEVEAAIEFEFRRTGASGPAYPSICGGGANATILHYIENSRRLKKGELLLIDAGAEVAGYAGDVTRTLPIGGTFSTAQRALYQIVLDAQLAAIKLVKPGVTFDAVHEAAVKVLTAGLIHLGLLSGPLAKAIKNGAYRRYYMHRTSHWLGLDVHDVGRYHDNGGGSRKLKAGMVLTVEPGLYVGAEKEIPTGYRNCGIRIEDDVLVTAKGHRVLTAAIPKAVDEVEAAMAAAV